MQLALLSVQARRLRESDRTLFLSDIPVDAAITRTTKGDTLQIFSAKSVVIGIAAKGTIQTASVDSKPIQLSHKNNLLEIKLSAGGHRVHIAY